MFKRVCLCSIYYIDMCVYYCHYLCPYVVGVCESHTYTYISIYTHTYTHMKMQAYVYICMCVNIKLNTELHTCIIHIYPRYRPKDSVAGYVLS